MYRYEGLPLQMVSDSLSMKEDNDCTVKALAIALDVPYKLAHRHLQLHCGRRQGKGVVSRKVIPQSLKNTPYKVGPYTNENRVSLSRFCKNHPKGRFYVAISGHAVAVVDGVVYDHTDSSRRMVKWAIRVYPKGVD